MSSTDLADLVAEAAEASPDRLAVVESGGRAVTWGELEADVARCATGLGRLGVLAGHRVMIAVGNRLEFVTSYLGVLRAQVVAVPVNPRSTADELARMIADSGSRLRRGRRRGAAGGPGGGGDGRGRARRRGVDARRRPGLARRTTLGSWRSATERGAGEIGYDDLVSGEARPVPPLQDPEKLRRPALHQRYVGSPARRDAHPPRAARQHRAGRGRRAEDDPRRRRGARRAAAVPRLRPQRRPRRRAAPPRQAAAGRAVRPGRRARHRRGRGVQRAAGRPGRVRPLAPARPPRRAARTGAARAVRLGPAGRRGGRRLHRGHRRSPSTRATA